MAQATSEPGRCCEVCGDPIRQDNRHGVCQRTAACKKEYSRKKRSPAEPRYCEACGRRLNTTNQTSLCSYSDLVHREARMRKRYAANPARYAVIHAGDVFGMLTVLDEYDPLRLLILCRCSCGDEKRMERANLAAHRVSSCGCLRYVVRQARRVLYLTAGTTFGLLTLTEDVASCTHKALFRCECGTERRIRAVSVKKGYTKSCGCLTETLGGFSKHPLHSTWHSMRQRCYNPKTEGYKNYGGREDAEITVCDRWRTDPWAFAEDICREIGLRPEGKGEKGRPLYELDRVNNNRGYWCGHCAYCASRGQFTINVRWSDKKTQKANQRTVKGLSRELAAIRASQPEAVRPGRASARKLPAPILIAEPLFTESDIRQ